MKTWPVLVAILFFLGKFAWNRELSKLKGRSRMEEEAIAAAKDDKNFWATLDGHLRDRRALMDHDEPNFVSAVTDSAFLLRENISKTVEKYPGVSGPMRNYAMLLRDEIKDFLDRVKNVERRAGFARATLGSERSAGYWRREPLLLSLPARETDPFEPAGRRCCWWAKSPIPF
jgi:hypothetical protein